MSVLSRSVDVRIGPWRFDHAIYDHDGDVLYLYRGQPSDAVEFDASPEGHALRLDAQGHLVGVTVVDARRLLDRDGHLTVSVPPEPPLVPLPPGLSGSMPSLELPERVEGDLGAVLVEA